MSPILAYSGNSSCPSQMASFPPRIASHDWLSRAAIKLQKSIFRTVDFRYRDIIKKKEVIIEGLESDMRDAQDDISRLEDELGEQMKRVRELEGQLNFLLKPEVAVKDIQTEVFRVKSTYEKRTETNTIEETKKRKLEHKKEIQEITILRDAPSEKILKVIPGPRSIPPLPVIPKKKVPKRSRERSTSPQPTATSPSTPNNTGFKKRERSTSPQPASIATLSPVNFINPNPQDGTGQWKKRKKDKDKKKT